MSILDNTRDFLFMMGSNGDDPIVRYSFVNPAKMEDGMFAWIRFGVNTNNDTSVNPAAFKTPDGGVMNPKGPVAMMTGGGFGMGGGMGGGWGGWGKGKGLRRWLSFARSQKEDDE